MPTDLLRPSHQPLLNGGIEDMAYPDSPNLRQLANNVDFADKLRRL